jgi:two-component sensor histidine kinase
LLRLQKAELNSEEARLNFEEAINRIMVISSIHEKLYKQENLSELKLKTYLEDLVEDIKTVYDIDNKIETKIICTIPKINEKTIVPLGLLINELVSNSLKHAFKEKQAGKIRLELTPEADNFKILYKDDGIWEDCSKEDGFGLELIRIFTEQLNGTYSLKKNESGSFYTFQLSVQKD